MNEAWRELLFADEDPQAKQHRDPFAPAKRSPEAPQKITERTLEDGSPVHSFRTLPEELATIVRNTCVTRSAKTPSPTSQIVTTPNSGRCTSCSGSRCSQPTDIR